MSKSKMQEETSTELKQPAFIDLYNLHLQAGIAYKACPKDILRDENEQVYVELLDVFQPVPPEEYHDWKSKFPLYTQEIKMPTVDEKQQIINFFKNHAPHVTKYLTKQDIEEVFEKQGRIDIIRDEIWTLGFYENQHGISWFESEDFLSFTDEYQYIQKLVDGYLKDSIEPNLISWLKERRQESKQTLRLKKVESQEFVNPMEIEEQTISLKNYQILYEVSITSGLRFGLGLGVLFFQIYANLAQMLARPKIIDKCKLCPNVFKVNKNQIYCSLKCRQVPDTKKKREQSDKIHQELCELIDEWLGPKQESEWIDADRIAGYLSKEFSIGLVYQNDLGSQNISAGLRWQFENNGISLSDNATIKREGSKWLITDENKTYIVKKEEGKLKINRKTCLLNKTSPSHSIGTYLNKPEFKDKLEEEKKITIQPREARKHKEYKFIRM